MTVNVQTPFVMYLGNGVLTRFTFAFSIVGVEDLFVLVDDVPQAEFSEYDVENLTKLGGDVVFVEAPISGAVVMIFRATTKSQNVDYESFASFPADTHESNLDKITYILQEISLGGVSGTFNLSAIQEPERVLIDNDGGTDAELAPWVSGLLAGVYMCEVTDLAPEDGTPTDKPDGYIWLELA